MGSSTDGRWEEETWGGDRVLVRRTDGVSMVFALGPARGRGAEPSRPGAALDAAGSGVVTVRTCRQVHGNTVVAVAPRAHPMVEAGDCDGLVTDLPATALAVWTADCVPVLLAGNGVVAAVHAGWRGCASDVVGVAVGVIEQRFGSTAGALRAALGPSVCGRCYEIGSEVADALGGFGFDESRWLWKSHVDLRGFLTARLEALGVASDRIESVGPCTVESPDLASYRRDGSAAGRQWSLIFRAN